MSESMVADLMKEAREADQAWKRQMEGTIEGVRNTINEHGQTLAEIKANTSPLPDLHRRLRDNESSTSNLWTVLKVTWAVFVAILGAGWLWVKH
jgi:polyhydroxyalkanoate synthesis regulator phasin